MTTLAKMTICECEIVVKLDVNLDVYDAEVYCEDSLVATATYNEQDNKWEGDYTDCNSKNSFFETPYVTTDSIVNSLKKFGAWVVNNHPESDDIMGF